MGRHKGDAEEPDPHSHDARPCRTAQECCHRSGNDTASAGFALFTQSSQSRDEEQARPLNRVKKRWLDIQLESDDLLSPAGLSREQIGWLAEHDLDRAVLVESRGRLQPFIPLFDTRRVDRVYAWEGIAEAWFIQAKAAGYTRRDGRYSWMLPAQHFTPYERFSAILSAVDLGSGRLRDPVWLVPSLDLPSLAAHAHDAAAGGPVYEVTASPIGHDKLSPFRTTLDDLWRKLAPAAGLALPVPERFPSLHQEQGAFYEFSQVAETLRESQDDILLFRPASDVAGRDLLVQLVDSPLILFLQIKGTSRLAERDSIHMLVRRRSFFPSADFWLAFYYYQVARGSFFEDCWLVPSLDFAGLTKEQHDATTLSFEARLDPAHDRWRDFRHPFTAQGSVLRQALRQLR